MSLRGDLRSRGRHVHGHGHFLEPRIRIRQRVQAVVDLLQDVLQQRFAHPHDRGRVNHLLRRSPSLPRMVPAQQRLQAVKAGAIAREDRLIPEPDLPRLDGTGQILFDVLAAQQTPMHRLIEAIAPPRRPRGRAKRLAREGQEVVDPA